MNGTGLTPSKLKKQIEKDAKNEPENRRIFDPTLHGKFVWRKYEGKCYSNENTPTNNGRVLHAGRGWR